MKLPIVTVTARTGAEPELRFLNDGTAVCAVRAVWSQDVPPEQQGGEWTSARETWATIEWWGKAGEHTADLAIGKGDTIRVTGALWMDEYTRRDGSPGQTLKLRADGTPKHWPKGERGAQSGTGRAGQSAPAPSSPPASTGGASHDDPPF